MTISRNVWKIAALLVVLSLISLTMISGTFARYTSTFAGEDTALVAKWDIVASGGGITLAEGSAAPLDLFSHAYNTNILATSGALKIVAPGVKGDFALSLTNNSDVDAGMTFDITEGGTAAAADVPIRYSFVSDSDINLTMSAIDLENALNADTAFDDIAAGGAPIERTVYWGWIFHTDSAGDNTDTDLGDESTDGPGTGLGNRTSYILNISATAEQLTPTAP